MNKNFQTYVPILQEAKHLCYIIARNKLGAAEKLFLTMLSGH